MELLTITEMQKELKISKNMAYKLTKLKGFPTIQIGKRIFISKDGLEKWIKENLGTQISI